jgi:Tfp pilus assembly protein FimT
MNTNRKRCQGEAGLTLQELLIAMVISTIIAGPIAGAIFTSLHTASSTISRTQQAVGANLLSTYFGTDVQNAVQVSANASEPAAICGSSVTSQTGLLLTTSPAQSAIFYYQGAGANSAVLYRQACAVGPGGPAAGGPIALLRQLSVAPQYACVPDCGAASWRSVTVQLTQTNSSSPGSYTTSVQASRRVG